MSLRTIVTLAGFWLVSLLVVANAQVFEQPRILPEPRVLSGPDVGFRVEAQHGTLPIGKLVIRVDGKWIEARIGTTFGTRPVHPE